MLLGGLSSCTLDTVNYTEKDQTNFPQTTNDQAQALAAIYQNLNVVNANPQMSWFYVAQLASDDALGGGGENDILMQAEDLLSVSTTNMTEQFWKDRYEGIMRATLCWMLWEKMVTLRHVERLCSCVHTTIMSCLPCMVIYL